MDCSGEGEECQRVRAFIQTELKHLYYFNNYLAPCPQLNETYTWRIMQLNDDPCPAEKANEATCTLGRIQVKTTETNTDGKSVVRYNHATVMGCANRQLLRRIQTAFESATCDVLKRNSSSVGVVRNAQIEHCRDISTQCYEKDYCIDWKQSAVRVWADQLPNKNVEFALIIGILAVVVIVMSAILIAGLLREPPSRLSNFPKTIGDESEAVKVLDVREKDISSIEVEGDESNGTGTRRPSVPPPPPPRLRPARGSTIV